MIKLHTPNSWSQMKYVAIHHSGGLQWNASASTQYLKAEDVNKAHRARWNFKSSLGLYGGYNLFIERNGKVTQFRAIGEETAAQGGHNLDTVSICLAGNFSYGTDKPTHAQTKALKKILEECIINGIKPYNIVPHRKLSQTRCYGDLPDNWAYNLMIPFIRERINTIQNLILRIQALLVQIRRIKENGNLSGTDRDCRNYIIEK